MGLIHIWQIHNFCEKVSYDWSFFSSICKWYMVYGAGENSELPFLWQFRKQKHAPILGHPRCHGQYEYKHVTPSKCTKQWGSWHIMSPNNCGQSAWADDKTREKDSRWPLHRRKNNMHRGFQAPMFDTDHQITTFCVSTQYSTVGWHTVQCWGRIHNIHWTGGQMCQGLVWCSG
jgi:hypothetical protein